MRFLFRVGDGDLFYDRYDRKVYIAVYVVVVGGLFSSAFIVVEDYNGWLSQLFLRVFATRKCLSVVKFYLPQGKWTAILLSQCIGNRTLIHPT